ncbi:Peptidoglycan/LPS O-acetylase OafA/YrhL, contains acyltransferase and SGNH-hydrolase domains [Massilia sp. PDC64]|nr:acyltransferase [Massilia sp. PDC64]SDF31112.1 Peptidoglycan/LPS O-acetylase OafA/YrhL, contains acyltransferase and SGNH-hydrolase domains [Massilia sp. PDC64]
MTQSALTSRLRGLDLLRATAILLVLMSHYMGFVSHAPTFGVVGKVGWAGVDLFFVLSGYLIGNQLLAPAARGEPLSLKAFFVRRLLRTLPNYYVVLAVYWLFPGPPLGGSSMAAPWRFLTFTQNFGLAYGQTFTHSWSLCIEEQFYLLLPLVVLALARIGFPVRLAWGLLAGGIVAGMATRAAAYALHGHDAFMAEVYYSSFCRADELLPGVAIALLRNFHPHAFARLLRHANGLCAAGVAASVGSLTCIHLDWPATLVTSTFGFSLLAISFALLTCAALSPACILNRIDLPGASQLALWSYAVYLVHKPVFMALRPHIERLHIDANAPATVAVVMGAGIAGGWVLYRCVETPFMRLRARWTTAHTVENAFHRTAGAR